MCYFENSRRIYALRYWRATGYKVVHRVFTDSLVPELRSEVYQQKWKKGVTNHSRGFDPRGYGPGFYAYRKRRDARLAASRNVYSVVIKVRLSGRVSRFAKNDHNLPGYKASKARLLKVY